MYRPPIPIQSPFRKATASDTARVREITVPESAVCPWPPGRPVSIYFAFRQDRIVYIGQSVDCMSRLKGHGPRDWGEVRFLLLARQGILHRVESAFIAFFQPSDNGQHGAFFDEADAECILREFGFFPRRHPLRRIEGCTRPYPNASDMRAIWHHLDPACRRLLVSLAKTGPRPAFEPHTYGAHLKTIALKAANHTGTRPPHIYGRRGRKRFIWISRRLAAVILRLAQRRSGPTLARRSSAGTC